MKYKFYLFLVLAAGLSACLDDNSKDNVAKEFKHFPGELFLRLVNDATVEDLQARLEELEVVVYVRPLGNGHVVKVPVENELLWFLNMQNEPLVRTAQYNRFGYDYRVVVSDSLPYLENQTLYTEIKFAGCNNDHNFTLEYDFQQSKFYETWLFKETPDQSCMDSVSDIRSYTYNINIASGLALELIDPYETRIPVNE